MPKKAAKPAAARLIQRRDGHAKSFSIVLSGIKMFPEACGNVADVSKASHLCQFQVSL